MTADDPPSTATAAERTSADGRGAELESVEVTGSLRSFSRLGTLARRCAAGIALAAPFAGSSLTLLPSCAIAGMIYGYLGHVHTVRGWLQVTRGGVRIAAGEIILPRATCAMAFALKPTGGRATVCFTEGRRIVAELTLDDPADAPRVLSVMGFGRDGPPIQVDGTFGPRLRATLGVLLGTVAALAFVIGWKLDSLPLIALAALGLAHAVLAMLLRDVRVARDGVWVSAPLSRVFVPFAELDGVSERGLWLRLHTARGDVSVTPPLLWPGERAHAARAALITALRQGKARVAALPEVIAASKRSCALRPHEGSFREPPLSQDDLLAVVTSARVPSAERARAAASLLRSRPGPHHVEGVRLAAESSASPQLRRALAQAIAADDEAAMTEAIAALDAEQPALRAGR